MKYFLITSILLFSLDFFGQETTGNRQREIGITLGVSKWNIQEHRFSRRVKPTSIASYGLFTKSQSEQSRFDFSATFGLNMKPQSGTAIRYGLINPQMDFTYQRRVGNIWLGPFLSSETLINIPFNTSQSFNNNPVSYTGVTSLGIAGDYNIGLVDDRITVNTGAQAALISHLIRPAYAHPYPEGFLDEEVFDPTREGIAKAIAKSGKIRSIKNVQSFRIRFGISYMLGDKFKIGLQYESQLLRVKEEKSLNATKQDLLLSLSYVY